MRFRNLAHIPKQHYLTNPTTSNSFSAVWHSYEKSHLPHSIDPLSLLSLPYLTILGWGCGIANLLYLHFPPIHFIQLFEFERLLVANIPTWSWSNLFKVCWKVVLVKVLVAKIYRFRLCFNKKSKPVPELNWIELEKNNWIKIP